jgi:hypothetical protein
MPVESEQAQAQRPATARPLEPEPPVDDPASAGRPLVAAPRPQHDDHQLPDGRYLIAYRSAPNA